MLVVGFDVMHLQMLILGVSEIVIDMIAVVREELAPNDIVPDAMPLEPKPY